MLVKIITFNVSKINGNIVIIARKTIGNATLILNIFDIIKK